MSASFSFQDEVPDRFSNGPLPTWLIETHMLVIQWTFSFLLEVWTEMVILGRIFT